MLEKLFTVLFTMLIILSLTACKKDEDTGKIGELAEIKGTDPFASPFSGSTDMFRMNSTESDKTSYAYSGNKIPKFFPKDMPIYSPASVTSCKILENNKGAIAMFLTRDTPDKIAEFYLRFLKEKNWKTEDKIMTENIFSLMAKKDSSTISISAAQGTNGTAITLAISLSTNR